MRLSITPSLGALSSALALQIGDAELTRVLVLCQDEKDLTLKRYEEGRRLDAGPPVPQP